MKIGVIGLGRMGRGIAGRVLGAGHELAVYNRTPGKDADLAAASDAADALVKGRYLRRDDVAAVMARVEAWWAQIHPAGSR